MDDDAEHLPFVGADWPVLRFVRDDGLLFGLPFVSEDAVPACKATVVAAPLQFEKAVVQATHIESSPRGTPVITGRQTTAH
jgi:hypothetical protein